MKVAFIILVVIMVGIVGIHALAATKPDVFTLQRTASINSTPERIFPFINDFRQWTIWSPFEKMDPDMKRDYGAIPAGKGATYAWGGNKNIGAGSMEILEVPAPQRVTIKLDFTRPFSAHNIAEFTPEPAGDVTNVTWSMRGAVPYFAKIIRAFMDMDKMVGTQFAEGLDKLKTAAER
jgi:hypothetical protein